MPRPNLLVVRAGDASLHERWLAGARQRSFDLMVSYYGDVPGRFNHGIEYYHAMKGPRWPAHDALWKHQRALFESYGHVGFACDDVDANADSWNRVFQGCAWYELDLAQPAVDGHVNWEITRRVPGSMLRYTSFVEAMCPVFSRRALQRVAPTFGESISGWGLSFVWSKLLPWPDYRSAIIDAVTVTHTTPMRQGTLRPTLDALGIDPEKERSEVLARHGIESFWMGEHARLRIAKNDE
ncbi:MAG TPA: hypothetical protein VLT89_01125 [Usitatibacter sp.]|nr:hypothetical protein [Usitatibacter sp.]